LPVRVSDTFQESEEVPSSVVRREGVDLVDDHGSYVSQEPMGVDAGRQEHRLQRLGRRQQDVGRIDDQALTLGWTDVTVPQPDPGTDEAGVAGQAGRKIVEQGAEGTQVEGAERPPSFGGDTGEHRQDRRLRLAAGGWRQEKRMVVLRRSSCT